MATRGWCPLLAEFPYKVLPSLSLVNCISVPLVVHVFTIALQEADNTWQFDIFGFAEATPGNTLSVLTYHYLKQTGVIEKWGHDETKLCRFLQKIEAGYSSSNPYHNRYVFAWVPAKPITVPDAKPVLAPDASAAAYRLIATCPYPCDLMRCS